MTGLRRPLLAAGAIAGALASGAAAQAQDLKWVAFGGALPPNTIVGGEEPGRQLPVCRGAHNNGVHPGKLVAGKCNIGWGGREIELRQFEVLTGDARRITWTPAMAGALPPGGIVGGQEPGRQLVICRAAHNRGLHPGKVVAGRCNIGWGGKEIVLAAFQVMVATPSSARDVTAQVENLGTPLQAKYGGGDRVYARNVWSMAAFGGRLFIASGNSNNDPPAKNAGPVEVYAYDPAASRFVSEGQLQDEQIDVFRVVNGALVIPGHDPKDAIQNGEMPWFKGNFYRRRPGGGWDTVRSLPLGIHNYDMIAFNGRIYAALGTPNQAAVMSSADGGRSWHKLAGVGGPWSRARSFFVAGGVLHVSMLHVGPKGVVQNVLGKVLSSVKPEVVSKVYAISGNSVRELGTDFFPGDGRKDLFVARPVGFRGNAVYIGADPLIDHDWTPAGLYVARSGSSVGRLALPDGAVARDLKVAGGTLYALGWRNGLVAVYATADLARWTELLAFRAPSFARSFEIMNGDFYFGLGSDPSPLNGAAGRILRVKAANVPKA